MKYTILSALLAATAVAIPTDYTPPGGWESIKYPPGTGENLPYYPPPPGGWENVKYPPGTGSNTGGGKDPANCPPQKVDSVFTSSFDVVAIGAEVRNGTNPAPGPADAVGYYHFKINSITDTICFNITHINVIGPYRSLARTATHVHQAARGASGPPRIAFPNPAGADNDRRKVSLGCLTAPFVTGINGTDGRTDTGSASGFKLKMIEDNPAGFFADAHTAAFLPGVVRGQFPGV